MDFVEYQQRAAQLSFYYGQPDKARDALAMAVQGLTGEFLLEVEEALADGDWKLTKNVREELGDFFWYVALYATANGVVLDKPVRTVAEGVNRTVYMGKLRKHIGRINETTKKRQHHGKAFDPKDIERQCYDLRDYAAGLAQRLGALIPELLDQNIAKLESRHGKETVYAG